MIEFLLIAIGITQWVLLRPHRDWYLVEWRFCTEESLCSTAFPAPPTSGFDKATCAAHKLAVTARLNHRNGALAFLKSERGGEIRIHQFVFTDLDAARMMFDDLNKPFGRDFQKVYLFRVVARSRKEAVTLPPEKYSAKDGQQLLAHPTYLWLDPRKSN